MSIEKYLAQVQEMELSNICQLHKNICIAQMFHITIF